MAMLINQLFGSVFLVDFFFLVFFFLVLVLVLVFFCLVSLLFEAGFVSDFFASLFFAFDLDLVDFFVSLLSVFLLLAVLDFVEFVSEDLDVFFLSELFSDLVLLLDFALPGLLRQKAFTLEPSERVWALTKLQLSLDVHADFDFPLHADVCATASPEPRNENTIAPENKTETASSKRKKRMIGPFIKLNSIQPIARTNQRYKFAK